MRPDTAAGYDALAQVYAEHLNSEIDHKPFDRAFLDAFAKEVGKGDVLDLGCGPGHVGSYLVPQVGSVLGVDLSPRMVEEARTRHPQMTFEVGDMLALRFNDAQFAGLLAFYSIIHLDAAELPLAFAEMRRVIKFGCTLSVAFHVGDEVRHVEELWGVKTCLDFRFLQPATIQRVVEDAGFEVFASSRRLPYPPHVEAQTERCYLLAKAR